jgi:phosphoglycerate dehydrogenase-like enzyme
MRPKVFVVQPAPPGPLERLAEVTDVEMFGELGRRPTVDELAAGIRDADYLFALGENRIDADLLTHATRLCMIAVMEIFPVAIDLGAATARGIPVTGLPSSSEITETTAEFTFALLSALSWRIPRADRFLREGRWVQYQTLALPTDRLRGATLGVVGLGAIGRGVARRAQANGMRVLYTDRAPFPAATEQALQVYWREIEDLFAEADVVVLSTILTTETVGLVGADLLARMKPDALLVNTSRGRVLDEGALADALEAGRLAGAALDVFEHELPDHEPGPDPRLLERDDVILTPHIGTSARQNRDWMAQQVVTNILRHHDGHRPRHVLNPEVYGEDPLDPERIA